MENISYLRSLISKKYKKVNLKKPKKYKQILYMHKKSLLKIKYK